jgi:hypothetical protein
MGTRGHSKLEEMMVGATTEKVIRHSRCPVLTVHDATSAGNLKDIVYATSLIKGEEKFARVVQQIQKIYQSKVHLVWINTPGVFESDVHARKALMEFASRLQFENCSINIFNDYSVEEGILHFADYINAGMITMSTHGRTGFAHLLAGSIAEDVAHHSRKPVLISVVK